LTFWSLNDAASRRQFEELKRIRRDITKEDRLLILSVCTDANVGENWNSWLRFLDEQGKVDYGDVDRRGPFHFSMDHKWLNAGEEIGDSLSSDAYGVRRLPEAFLIGPDKRLRAVRIPVDKLREVVKAALEKAP
jgi:hypothetical protein